MRLHSSLAVFIDGWEYSSGCTYEFMVAITCGIPTLDARLNPLSRDEGLRLMIQAHSELEKAGKTFKFLDDRYLQLNSPVFPVLRVPQPPVFGGSIQRLLLNMLGCMMETRKGIVVLSPAVDGRYFIGTTGSREAVGISSKEALEQSFRSHRELVKQLRKHPDDVVIDPTAFVPPNWSNVELYDLWTKAIETYARTLVLGDDWQFSEICVIAFETAFRTGSEVVDRDGRSITGERAIELVTEAAKLVEEHNQDGSRYRTVIESIISCRNVA